MLINLNLRRKRVTIFGGGEVAHRKARKLSGEAKSVTVISREFTEGLRTLARRRPNVKLQRAQLGVRSRGLSGWIRGADLVVAATNDLHLNRAIGVAAKSLGVPVCVVDNAEASDFTFPATTRKNGVTLAIYTGGRSPALARAIRIRMEKLLKSEDIRQVGLQDYARRLAKRHVKSVSERRKLLYKILKDKKIRRLLLVGRVKEARRAVRRVIERARLGARG